MACCDKRSFAASWYPLIIRVVLGVVFMAHGYQKLFTLYSPDPEQTKVLSQLGVIPAPAEAAEGQAPQPLTIELRKLHNITYLMATHPKVKAIEEKIGTSVRPVIMGWLAAGTEFFGGALILVGFLSRICALGLTFTMLVAVYVVHWNADKIGLGGWNIFDPDWQVGSGGWEYAGALGLLAFSVFLAGPGAVSIDRLLFRRRSGGDSHQTTQTGSTSPLPPAPKQAPSSAPTAPPAKPLGPPPASSGPPSTVGPPPQRPI